MILFRYVLREYFKFAATTLCLSLFLFVLFDFIHKTTTYFNRYNPEPGLVFRYYLLQLPFETFQALPIAALIASVIVMVLLNRSGEVTAMRAAGMSPTRIGLPLAVGGLTLSLFSFGLAELIVPYTARRTRFITQVLIEGGKDLGLSSEVHWIRADRLAVNFQIFHKETMTLEGVKLLELGENFAPAKTTYARLASLNPDKSLWNLKDVRVVHFNVDKQIESVEEIETLTLALPIEPQKLNIERRIPLEMSLGEISQLIRSGLRSGVNVLDYKISWHMKLAYHFAALLISLLGLSFGYRLERTTETIKSLLVAFTFGISYWFILSICKALSTMGHLHPFLSGWLANFWLAAIVILQLRGLHRERP